jgi:clan AA aspartic protease (TIGR02281 family)
MKSETSFELDGDLIVVDAVVIGPSARAQMRLVLDTGAVLTTLVPSVAESIGFSSSDCVAWSVTRTAAANERGYIVQLAQITTLGFTVPDLHAVVADLGYGIDGVIGMHFLSDFNFEIRPAERRVLVERIAP